MVQIFDVLPGSQADLAGIMRGDQLISINDHNINDVLDYSYYLAEKNVRLILQRGGAIIEARIKKREYADIGLEFETFLMDEKRSCRNKCVFCFIDQLPPGLRESLYFKDDDARLSFLQGNYVTMTNMSDSDIDRIIKMKMSPINISVHTTNPALREKMMSNRFAGRLMDYMRRLAQAGIRMNCQIVLCRHLNDRAELQRSMEDLYSLYPQVQSVSVVPAGLTKFREGLYPLEPFTPEECGAVIDRIEAFAARCREADGVSLFYAADEFYIKAGRPIPGEERYDDYPQLENGVGMIASMRGEFMRALEDLSAYNLNEKRVVSVATGAAAYDFICDITEELERRCPNFHCRVYRIENNFFGPEITVAGLLTGTDLKEQLKGRRLGTRLFLSSAMLRSDGDMFLDNMTPAQLEWELDVPISFTPSDGGEFVRMLLTE